MKKFWSLMATDDEPAPGKIGMHADAWGVRRLLTHVLRALRLGRKPRVPLQHGRILELTLLYFVPARFEVIV